MSELLNVILEADTRLFLFLNNLGTEAWDEFWLFITNKESWFPLYGAFLIICGIYLKKWKRILFLVLCIAALVLFVDQTTSAFFKPFIGRLRPCHYEDLDGLFRLVKATCGGEYSFFSGHSSNSFAVAVFIGLLLRKNISWTFAFLLFWAAMVAYSRIYVGVHFPLDILVGGIWGSLFGYVFYRLFQYLDGRFAQQIQSASTH